MFSLEFLDLVSAIAWRAYEKVVYFQDRFFVKLPVAWDSRSKQASARSLKECIPFLILSLVQIPIISSAFAIVYRQLSPRTYDPRFPIAGSLLITFASLLNIFVTIGSFSNIYKRREWSIILSLVGSHQFRSTKTKTNSRLQKWTKQHLWKKISIADLIATAVFGLLMLLGSAGFLAPLIQDADHFIYFFPGLPKTSTQYRVLKFLVRPLSWGIWSFYIVLSFFQTTTGIFFLILHGCIKIPRVPNFAPRQTVAVIENSFANLNSLQRLTLKLMEAAYREYRQFQIFVRPANDAMYLVVPDGLAGIGVVSIVVGFVSIKGFSAFPFNVYILFPTVFFICVALIVTMVPIACNVYEGALRYKHYWLSRIRRKEVRKRLAACRPMGIAAGQFGYVQRSLPMEMMNAIVDYICSLIVTLDFESLKGGGFQHLST